MLSKWREIKKFDEPKKKHTGRCWWSRWFGFPAESVATDGEVAAIFKGPLFFQRSIVQFHWGSEVCYKNLMKFKNFNPYSTRNLYTGKLTWPKASPVISHRLPLSEDSWDKYRSELILDPSVNVFWFGWRLTDEIGAPSAFSSVKTQFVRNMLQQASEDRLYRCVCEGARSFVLFVYRICLGKVKRSFPISRYDPMRKK